MTLPAPFDLAPLAPEPAGFTVTPAHRAARPRGLVLEWTLDREGGRLVPRWRRRRAEPAVSPVPPARAGA